MKRRIVSWVLVFVLCLSLSATVFAAPDTDFVIDEIGYLTESERSDLNEKAARIYDDCGVAIFFVYTTSDDLVDYDISRVVGGVEDYFVMIENETSWFTFAGGEGKSIDSVMEEMLRNEYDRASTYVGGVEDFLNAAAECFADESDAPGQATPGEEAFVYDDARLLSDSEKVRLSAKLHKISQEYDAQIVVATMDSGCDGDIDDYVGDLYDAMGFGYGGSHDGVLLLVCMECREFRILSNGYAADAIESAEISAITSAITPVCPMGIMLTRLIFLPISASII